MTKKHTRVELTFRVIFFVTLFFVVLSAVFVLLSKSEGFVAFIGNNLDSLLKYSNKSISFKGLEGTIEKGICFDEIIYKDLTTKEDYKLQKGSISFDFHRIFRVGLISVNADMENLYAENFIFAGSDLVDIPPYADAACFVDMPSNVELNNVCVKNLYTKINGVDDSNIVSRNFRILPTENDGIKNINFVSEIYWKGSKAGIASFSGELNQKNKKVNGNTVLKFAGQYISTELNVTVKRGGKFETGGYVSESKFDVETLSKWSGVLWQQFMPFSLKGNISFTGSWLYNSNVGLMGNLSGSCDKIQIVFSPFNFKIAEFSNIWNLLNGNLNVTDKGSWFLEAPAAFNGKLESVFNKEDRKWDSTFECRNLNIASLSDLLPMPLKFGFNIPKLSGQADFSLITVGKEPNTTLRVASNDIITDKNGVLCKLSGYAAWMVAEGFNNLEANITIRRMAGNPSFFARFSEKKTMLPGIPLAFEYKLHGDPKAELTFTGKFITGEGHEERVRGEASGVFHNGAGTIEADFDKYLTYGGRSEISLLDLLLAR